MPIQWFPGHMHATRQALAKRLPDIDVVIEMLDARLPGSSANPLLAQLAAGKPALKILNKQDLADPDTTAQWVAHLEAQSQTRALPLDAGATGVGQRLVAASRALVPHRGGMVKPVRVLVCGIPNVGKSTLVNSLLGKRRAKTGDEAGITKTEQRIALAPDFDLFDTPGMLWPKITVEASGYHLAASGAVGRNAYDDVEVALHLLARVRPRYADRLVARYKLRDLQALAALDDEALLTEVGRKRGGLSPGGQVNLNKAAEVVIHDFRSNAWGRISLETPDEYAAWAAAAEAAEAAKAARAAEQAAAKAAARSGRRAASSGSAPGEGADSNPTDDADAPPGG